MRSLGARVVLAVGAVLVTLSLASFGWVTAYRTRTVNAEAVHYGEALADALEATLAHYLKGCDHEGLQSGLDAACSTDLYDGAGVLGRAGNVLAAVPPLAGTPDPAREPRCSGCHGAGPATEGMRLETLEGGRRVVQVFRPILPGPSCLRCHPDDGRPLGYLWLDAVVTGPFERLQGETMVLLGVGLATVLLVLLGTYGALRAMVVRPLHSLREEVDRFERGEPASLVLERDDELGALAAALHRAGERQQRIVAEISSLASRLRDRGIEVQKALGRLREGVSVGRTAAEAILGSVDGLNSALEETREHLDAIASSTSDNSTSLIQMSASIDEVAGNADELAQQVSATSSSVLQMVQSIADVAGNVEGLAAETESTVSAVSQIDASTRQIEQSAREAVDLGERVAEAAEAGSQSVLETLAGIHDSYDVIHETARAMGELAEASRNIDRVVKIINEINDKTKLLALNAAIIAAQAGEHGRGFAVVAHEIQGLSDRTVASTGEISRIVRRIQDRVEAATRSVARGQEATARSVELAERAGTSLRRILETARVASDMNRQILRATEEQAKGSQSVVASMQQVSAMVSHIRHAAVEHRTSGELVGQSTEVMRNLTEQVKLATAEQAEVSRYISDAVAAIDRNLQELLGAVAREREETERILDHMRRLREQSGTQEGSIEEVEQVIRDLQAQIEGLEQRASALLGRTGNAGA